MKLAALSGSPKHLAAAADEATRWTVSLLPIMISRLVEGAFWLLIVVSIFLGFFSDLFRQGHVADSSGCARAEIRLNPYEYELQRRSCEAVRHGAGQRYQQRRR